MTRTIENGVLIIHDEENINLDDKRQTTVIYDDRIDLRRELGTLNQLSGELGKMAARDPMYRQVRTRLFNAGVIDRNCNPIIEIPD